MKRVKKKLEKNVERSGETFKAFTKSIRVFEQGFTQFSKVSRKALLSLGLNFERNVAGVRVQGVRASGFRVLGC